MTGVPGQYDSAMVHMLVLATPSNEQMTSSVRLEFDRERRLILFQESRAYVQLPGQPRRSHTTVGIGTGIGRQTWSRVGSATNFIYRGPTPSQELLRAPAEELWHHPRLGVQELYRLVIAKCGDGGPYRSTFEVGSPNAGTASVTR